MALLLLGLLLQIRLALGQSQLESAVCTIEPLFVLIGLTSTPEEDAFGSRVSLSQDGTIAAIGAFQYRNLTGYVQVFRFENNGWTQLGSTTIFGDPSSYTSTNALSDDGSILAVGGALTSAVRIFSLVDDNLDSLGNNITSPTGDTIGYDLDISGDGTILAASNPLANNYTGEVLVFESVGGTWIQKGRTLQGQVEEKYFGFSVSLSQDGSVLAVGIPDTSDGQTSGFVRIFEFVNNDWGQIGQTLEGTNAGERFGYDVSLSSDGRTLAVGAPFYSGNSDNFLASARVYRFGSDGQWFEPGSMLIGKSLEEQFGSSLSLSGDASILVVRGDGLLRFFEANGNEWIEVREVTTSSTGFNNAAISRDGSTAMGGASVFDVSCPQLTTPNPATASPISIGVIVGASIGGAVFLVIAVFVGIRVNKRKDDAGESVRALQSQGTPMESQDAQQSQRQSLAYATGAIVYDGQGEVLEPFTLEAQAVLLASDNPTTMQIVTTDVQTPSAGWLEPSPPQQVIDTPMPAPMAVFTPSDGYNVQFKDQTRSASPERRGQLDP